MYSNEENTESLSSRLSLSKLEFEKASMSAFNVFPDRNQMILNLEVHNPIRCICDSPFMEKLQSRMELYFDRME